MWTSEIQHSTRYFVGGPPHARIGRSYRSGRSLFSGENHSLLVQGIHRASVRRMTTAVPCACGISAPRAAPANLSRDEASVLLLDLRKVRGLKNLYTTNKQVKHKQTKNLSASPLCVLPNSVPLPLRSLLPLISEFFQDSGAWISQLLLGSCSGRGKFHFPLSACLGVPSCLLSFFQKCAVLSYILFFPLIVSSFKHLCQHGSVVFRKELRYRMSPSATLTG